MRCSGGPIAGRLILLTLVLGGARSGKSRYAEQCARNSGKQVVYIATATVTDEEMRDRIERHRKQRCIGWSTVEEPIYLANAIQSFSENSFILIDCLTLWLSNIMFDSKGDLREAVFEGQATALLKVLDKTDNEILMVSNEIGSGVVAVDKNTRRFVDEAGLLNQKISQLADRVVLITAGLPLVLK